MEHLDHMEPRLRHALARVASVRPTSDFDLNSKPDLGGRQLRPAAVLLPIQHLHGTWQLILTKRPATMKHHPGQIALPGGKVDATDADPTTAALREAHEEIGLASQQVSIVGHLPNHQTITSFDVHPFVGIVAPDFIPTPEPNEVDEVFYVPLSHILNPAAYQVQSRIWKDQDRRYLTAAYGPYYIWGATARILKALCDCMDKAP